MLINYQKQIILEKSSKKKEQKQCLVKIWITVP
jgi:hypothetical protein